MWAKSKEDFWSKKQLADVPQRGPGENPGRGSVCGGSPPQAGALLLNKHAIFTAALIKIVIKGCIIKKSYCAVAIFSKIRTAHFEISTTLFVLKNTLF